MALATALIALPCLPARADQASCADLRSQIVGLDSTWGQSEVKQAYHFLRTELAYVYEKLCRRADAISQDPDFWFDADGNKLGPATDDRPANAAFLATDEIGRTCAQSGNPSVCAMMLEAYDGCAHPADDQQRAACEVQGAYPMMSDPVQADVPALPPYSWRSGPAAQWKPPGGDLKIPQALCDQFKTNADACLRNQQDMGTYGTQSTSRAGQAGAFGDCYQVYNGAYKMCTRSAQTLASRPAAPAIPKAASAEPPRGNSKPGTGSSQAPPPADPDAARKQQALGQMSPQCQGQLNQLFQGADTGNSAQASAAYGTLRAQCDASLRSLAGLGGLDLPERTMTPRSQRLMDRAMSGDPGRVPEAAAAAAQGGDGGGYNPDEVMNFALAMLGAMNGLSGMYVPRAGGHFATTNMNSLAGRRIPTTYGQGAPLYRTPRQSPSTITGTIGGH